MARAPVRPPYWGKRLWLNPASNPAKQAEAWAKSDPYGAALMRALAKYPDADWLTDSSAKDAESRVDRMLDVAAGQVRVIVIYRAPNRDLGSHSAGGAEEGEYLDWIRSVARGLRGRPAILIGEPDGIAMSGKMSSADRGRRLELFSAATDIIGEAGGDLFWDAGSSNWISVDRISELLIRAGVQRAKGFSLNVSGTQFLEDEVRYGNSIRQRVGLDKWFTVDTSRSGRGQYRERPDDYPNADWCCSPLRGVGPRPTLNIPPALAKMGLAAKLFVKSVGGEDGACGRCTKAGRWNPDYARELADLAIPPLVLPPPD